MGNQLVSEMFTGKYDGTTPSIMLNAGQISDGKNVRVAGVSGGWKPRKGCRLLADQVLEHSWWPIDLTQCTWGGAEEGHPHNTYGPSFVDFDGVMATDEIYGYYNFGQTEAGSDGLLYTSKIGYKVSFKFTEFVPSSTPMLFAISDTTAGVGSVADIYGAGNGMYVYAVGTSIYMKCWDSGVLGSASDAITDMITGQEYTMYILIDGVDNWLFIYKDRAMTDELGSAYINNGSGSHMRYVYPFVTENGAVSTAVFSGQILDPMIYYGDYPHMIIAKESDAANRTNIYADKVVVSNLDTDESSYVYMDMGDNFFSGSFTVKMDIKFTSFVGTASQGRYVFIGGFSNTLGALINQTDYIGCRFYFSGTNSIECFVDEFGSITAGAMSITGYQWDGDTATICITRDETTGDNGHLRVNDDQNTANDFSLLLGNDRTDYRYFYLMSGQGPGGPGGDAISFEISNVVFSNDIHGPGSGGAVSVERYGKTKSFHELDETATGSRRLAVQRGDKLVQAEAIPPIPEKGTDLVNMPSFGRLLPLSLSEGVMTSGQVESDLVVCSSRSKPLVWSGYKRKPIGFLVHTSTTDYVDYLPDVTDDNPDSFATVPSDATSKIYVCSPQIAHKIHFRMGSSVNNNAQTATVKSWVSGAWATRGTIYDGTDAKPVSIVGTLYKDGYLEWVRNSTDTMRILSGTQGYWYEISFSGALDAVTITECFISCEVDELKSRWDGEFLDPAEVMYFDGTTYTKYLGRVTDTAEATYMDIGGGTTSSYIYIKSFEPICGVGFALVPDQVNTASQVIDNFEYWDGDSWAAGGAITDSTLDSGSAKSFNTSGNVFFDAASATVATRKLQGDDVPGYWYRISWNGTLSTGVHIYNVVYAAYPKDLSYYDGAADFAGRVMLWGDGQWPNYLRVSGFNDAGIFSGVNSSHVGPFGGSDKIVAGIKFLDWFWVFKRRGVYFINQDMEITTISNQVGLASIESLRVVDAGFPDIHKDERRQVLLWQDDDGVYVTDGTKPLKVSNPVDNFFNVGLNHSDLISADDIDNLGSFVDNNNDEYHLLLSDGELIFNYVSNEWYPPWEREVDLTGGTSIKSPNGRSYTIGASQDGYVFLLETDTTDKTTAGADANITHYVTTRDIYPGERFSGVRYTLRSLVVAFKAQSAGTVTPSVFKNSATSGTAHTAVSLVSSGYELTFVPIDTKYTDCVTAKVKLNCSGSDFVMETYMLVFELDVRGKEV